MSLISRLRPASPGPALSARWAHGNKDGVGTAYSSESPVWFTISAGITSEIFYPTVDTPQTRDLQFLVTDGSTFFHDGRRNFDHHYKCLGDGVPAFRVTCRAKDQPYQLVQDIITSPHFPTLLIRCRLEAIDGAPPGFLDRLHVYVLVAPHIDGHGDGNNAYVVDTHQGRLLLANRDQTWMAVGATVPLLQCSAGYSGANDGWQDIIAERRRMTFAFDCAENGNVALTGELDLSRTKEFVLGVAFGIDAATTLTLPEGIRSLRNEAPAARSALAGALSRSFEAQLQEYVAGWRQAFADAPLPDPAISGHQDHLYRQSRKLLLCHEDEAYHGAFVASLSIPWGEETGDQDGGYHLVWPRDMCQSATGLLAAGKPDSAMRALMFLAACQQADGTFRQNFMVDGTPFWTGLQLDEVSFPILLAYRLDAAGVLGTFDPLPMVRAAARALILLGPQTPMERWEEAAGFSPSTLAANIASLICAAALVRRRENNQILASLYEDHADFLERHVDDWTTTKTGTLVAGIPHHYVRISNREDPDQAWLRIANQTDELWKPAREVVDGGFLELVRYGIRAADSPLMRNSVQVIDQVLCEDFAAPGQPPRPCFYRYNFDGYGQKADGRGFKAPPGGTGLGGPWPLLVGERAHYELALGPAGDPQKYLRAFESFATQTGLFPEQVWALPDNPAAHLVRGGPTGAAVPLAWAHAEYVKLIHSLQAGAVYDRIAEVENRYVRQSPPPSHRVEVWNLGRQNEAVTCRPGQVLRFPMGKPFRLAWSQDGWATSHTYNSEALLDRHLHLVDIETQSMQPGTRIDFTFQWADVEQWEGRDFSVTIH